MKTQINIPTILFSFLFFLPVAPFLSGCQNDHAVQTEKRSELPAAKVRVEEVLEEVAVSQIEVMGTLQAVEQASISARISGQIIELPIFLGSEVKKGALLVKITAGEITAKLLQAKAQLEQAKRNLVREKKLEKQGASTLETVHALQDVVNISEAAFQEAKTMLSYSIISAPFDGTVMKKMANIGDLASPGTPLLRLVNDTKLQVVAQIPETLIARIHKGAELEVSIPAAEIKTTAIVNEVAPSADPQSRTAPVKLDLKASPLLRPGQFARVSIRTTKERGLTVAQEAVVPFGQMNKVFLVIDGHASLRLVKTGAKNNNRIEILAGLSKGDRVVVEGAKKLLNGQQLDIQ